MDHQNSFLDIYEKVLKTEIGLWIQYQLSQMDNKTFYKLFHKIRENLENGLYHDKRAFYEDFVQTNRHLSSIFSQTSEIGLGLETLNQLLEEELKIKKEPNSLKELKRMLLPHIAELQLISEKMPNQFKQYMQLHHYTSLPVEPYAEPEQPKEYPEEQFHIQRLQKILLKLQTDHEIGDVADMAFAYEVDPRAGGNEDSYELVLEKCQPEFLQLIWNYLKCNNIVD